ncbi:family 43 glycosylhydrolase [Chitinophaga polysaccharea]|uniref:glycoside hydrolase family 43 protein n=1 Tax=Chitinophaga TaxID=79328 RepID=UPI0014556BFB|nr:MULTISPECIES: glycoside hydrolase family 43 protein [Chitinophaga]NLR59532.1 family 43 glycosylhydrolase [Chitinophaga polysaccharea]NLU96167.1 family 43 glycosylhydrolase [Chitinophaga sp. Ak27]
MKSIVIIFALMLSGIIPLLAQERSANIPGDFADPSILRQGNQYYAIGTSSEWGPQFPIFRSLNLRQWKQTGFLFDQAPAWTVGSFWAPEYFYHHNTYFVYYTARRKSDGVSCIGVATSAHPDHGFKDHGILIEYGREAIDAFVFDDNGQLYITWKAYGLDKRPIEILGSKLAPDGLSLVGQPFTLLKDNEGKGMEGQSILKKGNFYYLFYSAGACCGADCSYHVNVARSTTITGPYTDYRNNPVLTDGGNWKCPGHGTFVQDTQGATFYLYHAYNKQSNVFTGREGLISALSWNADQWPVFSSSTALENQPPLTVYHYDFAHVNNDIFWQWDFRNMQPLYRYNNGILHLSGKYSAQNPSGIALTLRPYSAAYDISTAVVNHNPAAKGLVVYGDAGAAAGIAVSGNKAIFWISKDGKRRVLNEQSITDTNSSVYLKLSVFPDFTCRVYWKQQQDWEELTPGKQPYTISFLPPWDRSPRPGLSFMGTEKEEAVFSFFEIRYR